MKIYKASITDPWDGCLLTWHSSLKSANRWVEEKRSEYSSDPDDDGIVYDCEPASVELMSIKPTREGILRWLNMHFTSDNG